MTNLLGPQRIVCLTEETTETLYLLGEQDRIVGISGYTTRPPEARSKPKISAFTSAKIEQILDLKPDLVIGFSNLQAAIASDLIKAGVNVLVFNQRSVEEVLETILMVSRIVAAEQRGMDLVARLRAGLQEIADAASRLPRRPRVYFEEWMDPLISGIRWVEELIEIAGGEAVFPKLRFEHCAKNRVVTTEQVAAADPEIIIASWCGRKVVTEKIREREGWSGISAVRNGHIYEIKSSNILQPGPAALTDGVRQVHQIIAGVVA